MMIYLYRSLFVLLLQRLPVEDAHRLASVALRMVRRLPGCTAVMRRCLVPHDSTLRVKAMGLEFPSPLGVAAGMDKDASWFESLGLLGFGFVEVGTVTAHPQHGNTTPRVFRIARDKALLNKMGFPNPGARNVASRLQHRSGQLIVGVNVGKGMATPIESAGEDYRAAVREVAPVCDYLVLNVSSPNTPGLGELQAVELLRALVVDVRRELATRAPKLPVLVKISPDISDEQVDAIASLALELALDGIVAVNTSADRSTLSDASAVSGVEGGGVSGPPLRARAVEVLERLYKRVGDSLVLVSVGGISTPEDAWQRITAGATLIQAHTGFIYGGPGWPTNVNRALARRVHEAGATSIQELIGRGGTAQLTPDPAPTAPSRTDIPPERAVSVSG